MNLFYSFLRGVLRLSDKKELSDTATPPHANSNRLHVFHGSFASEIDATDYCLTPMGPNKPEPLTRDLPDAMIDTTEVEIIFGAARITSAVGMLTDTPDAMLQQIGADNTLILIAEKAFGGLPYTLNDTQQLRYAGAFEAR